MNAQQLMDSKEQIGTKLKTKKAEPFVNPALYCFAATGNSQVVTLLFYPIIWFKGFKNVLRGFQH
jgi:hypothetical protein